MNTQAAALFSRVILSPQTVHVKLLGDSITHGVGGTGFDQNGAPITAGFARNPDGFCWANLFRQELESRYDCTVVNNACTGTDIGFILAHFDELVSDEDDLILCTIGTNNRHQYEADGPMHTKREHMKLFYENILRLHDRFLEKNKAVVFVANIPASAENEKDGPDYVRLFHMCDVADLYHKAAVLRGFPLVDLYSRFLGACDGMGCPVDALLADGLHPSDEGYRLIYRLIMDELGLSRTV